MNLAVEPLHVLLLVLFSVLIATIYMGVKVESLIKEFKQERNKMKQAALAYSKIRRRR